MYPPPNVHPPSPKFRTLSGLIELHIVLISFLSPGGGVQGLVGLRVELTVF